MFGHRLFGGDRAHQSSGGCSDASAAMVAECYERPSARGGGCSSGDTCGFSYSTHNSMQPYYAGRETYYGNGGSAYMGNCGGGGFRGGIFGGGGGLLGGLLGGRGGLFGGGLIRGLISRVIGRFGGGGGGGGGGYNFNDGGGKDLDEELDRDDVNTDDPLDPRDEERNRRTNRRRKLDDEEEERIRNLRNRDNDRVEPRDSDADRDRDRDGTHLIMTALKPNLF